MKPGSFAKLPSGCATSLLFAPRRYAEGTDLFRRRSAVRRDEPAVVKHIVGPLLSAISSMHLAGIVHRDIKPENVLLEASRALSAMRSARAAPRLYPVPRVAASRLTPARRLAHAIAPHFPPPPRPRRPITTETFHNMNHFILILPFPGFPRLPERLRLLREPAPPAPRDPIRHPRVHGARNTRGLSGRGGQRFRGGRDAEGRQEGRQGAL